MKQSGQNQKGGGDGSTATTTAQTATNTSTATTTHQETSGGEGQDHGDHHGSETSDGEGHGHSDHHGSETLPKTPSDKAHVAMITNDAGYHFDPHIVWITKGGTVTWTLESGTHSTTAYHPANSKPLRIPEKAAAWNSGVLSKQGTTFKQTINIEGVYDYFCIPHESRGMLGSVIVGHPNPSGQPGLTPPQKKLPKQAQQKITELNEMAMKILE
jgi:plastocyanin